MPTKQVQLASLGVTEDGTQVVTKRSIVGLVYHIHSMKAYEHVCFPLYSVGRQGWHLNCANTA